MIKTTITKMPTQRAILIECPNCKTILSRTAPIGQKEGSDKCALCHVEFEWKETDE